MQRLLAVVLALAVGGAATTAPTPAEAQAAKTERRKTETRAQKKKKATKAERRRPGKRKSASNNAPGARRRAARQQAETPRPALLEPLRTPIVCPPDMVAVAGRVCVDRFETSLVDRDTGRAWSPFFTPDRERAAQVFAFYTARRDAAAPGSLEATFAVPAVPPFAIEARAVSAKGVLPQGYLSADQAEAACRAAEKRLCTEAEWITACRGDVMKDYPYGDRYEQGACNVFREDHPSAMLHGNAARYHDDPRNGQLVVAGRTLLLETGSSPRCASKWGDDAIFDMVGNLDEWVADAQGVFVGGFYSRGTRAGCFSRVSAHPRRYSDYSTGTRCCKDPEAAARR
jgi:hypothetical protein